jgi:hypothetical protein
MERRENLRSEAAVFVDEFNASAGAGPPALGEGAGTPSPLYLRKRLRALRHEVLGLRAENRSLRAGLDAASARNARLESALQNIHASRGWKLVLWLRGVRDAILRRSPVGRRPADPGPAGEQSA